MFWRSNWYWLTLAAGAVLLFAVNVVFKFIVAPIRLHAARGPQRKPRHEPTDVEHLTPETRDFMGRLVRDFVAEGFEVAANVTQLPQADGDQFAARPVQALLVHRGTGDVAVVISVVSTHSRSLVAAVRSDFADGTSVSTGNGRSVSVFPRDRAVDWVSFSWVTDGRTLCEAHRRRMKRLGKSDLPRVPPLPGGEMQYMDREWERIFARLAKCGEYWFDAKESAYRLTWKGAFFHAWRLTDPIKRWRTRLRDWRARRQWRSLGMDLWQRPTEPRAEALPAAATTLEHASPHRPGELPYEASLPAGEVREDWAGAILTVRSGNPTPGEFLADRWFSLVWLAFLFSCMAAWLYMLRLYYTMVRQMTARPVSPALVPQWPLWAYIPMAVCAVMFLYDVVKLVRGVLIARRGTTVLTANPAGLTYRNVPAWRGSGHVARDELEGLGVRLESVRLRGKTFRLEARRHGHPRHLPLVTGRDPEALLRVAESLNEAMGIGIRRAAAQVAEPADPAEGASSQA